MKLEGFIIFIGILVGINASCYSNCMTCVDPNSWPYRFYCTSCYDNHFLYTNACYACQYCQSYGSCAQCGINTESTSSSLPTYILISAIAGGSALLLVILICCCRRMCQGQDGQAARQDVQIPYMSDNRLVTGLPSQAYEWKKAQTTFNMDQNCAICLDSGVFLQTSCYHNYHPKCILMWIKKGQDCPLCKSKTLNPIKVYCTQCFDQYVEIDLRSLWGLCDEGKWKRCPSCKQLD